MGLPWLSKCWEAACQCRGHGFDPWSGKIPHATRQLSLCATTTEPACPTSCALQQREATAVRNPCTAIREYPQLTATRQSPCTARRPSTAKKKKNTHLPHNPATAFPGIYSRGTRTNVFRKACTQTIMACLSCSSSQLETNQIFPSGYMVKQTVVYPHNVILLSN